MAKRKKQEEAPPPPPEHPLQQAVDAAVLSGDPKQLEAVRLTLPPVAPDPERRCVAYGYLRLAERAAAGARFAEAHQLVRSAGVARGRPDAVVAIMAGNVAMLESRRMEGEQRAALLEQAAKAYEQAHHVDAKHAAALHNWGNALVAIARSQKGSKAKAAKAWALAAEKYAAAVALDPARHDAWFQWGTVLAEQALAAKGEDAGNLLDEACVRFAEAVKLDEKKGAPLLAWGNALLMRGRTRLGSEAAALYDGACEKYKLASKLLPGRPDLLRNWGNALAARADVCYGETAAADADRFRTQAVAKYDEAAALREGDHATIYLAGVTLLARAAAKRGAKPEPSAKSIELATAAHERIGAAVKLARGEPAYLFALARAEARRGEPSRTVAALERWAAASPKPARKDLDTCADFDALREDERFKTFRKTFRSAAPRAGGDAAGA